MKRHVNAVHLQLRPFPCRFEGCDRVEAMVSEGGGGGGGRSPKSLGQALFRELMTWDLGTNFDFFKA